MDEMTQEALDLLCAEWQKRLRLQDWHVLVRLRDWVDMSVFGRGGECHWNLQHKSANVEIVRQGHRCDGNTAMTPGSIEQTLVHELLHLHFAPFNAAEDTLEQAAQEQAINAIAAALVGLKRGVQGGEG